MDKYAKFYGRFKHIVLFWIFVFHVATMFASHKMIFLNSKPSGIFTHVDLTCLDHASKISRGLDIRFVKYAYLTFQYLLLKKLDKFDACALARQFLMSYCLN